MPTVDDVLELAQALGGRAVAVAPARCVAVRNRNSSCSRCSDACAAGAVTVRNNEVSIDPEACTACGSCVPACPTGAFVALEPSQGDLAAALARSARALGGGRVCIACARAASQADGDPDKFAELPCLGRVGELLLVELAARGVREIVLVDGGCESCRFGTVSAAVDLAVREGRGLFSLLGCDAKVLRASEFPDDARMLSEREQRGAARRGFLSSAGGMAKDAALIAAEQTLAQKRRAAGGDEPVTLRQRLGIGADGKLPRFRVERNLRLLDALCELGGEAGDVGELDTRFFGNVVVDASKCSGCGMCVMFCPTGALAASLDGHPRADEGLCYREFSAADCVQCGLCVDVCLSGAVSLSTCVDAAELFDFEPRLLEARKPEDKPVLFGRRH